MASLQGSLLVATSILEGAVNACGVGADSELSGNGSGNASLQALRPLSLISEVQQMMQSQQVCYQPSHDNCSDLDDGIDEGHHSPEEKHSSCFGTTIICPSQMNYHNRSFNADDITYPATKTKTVLGNIIDYNVKVAGVGVGVAECTCVGVGVGGVVGVGGMDSRVRRRTKSLGALRQGQAEGAAGSQMEEAHDASQADSGTNSGTLRGLHASSQFLPYLFTNQTAASLSHQDRAALFASCPSVKCDIVEYL